MKNRRYPGVKPFETSDAVMFFGRQRDCQDLLDLIFLEKLVVLFGKSGYGKSSLLNAGIIPKLTDPEAQEHQRFQPLTIRFKSYIPGESIHPCVTVVEALKPLPAPAGRLSNHILGETTSEVPSFWAIFKQYTDNARQRFVLLFDQFEEFFTYPTEWQLQFRQNLAELLYTKIPQSVRNRWPEFSEAQKESLTAEMDVRVVFAIREDRLSWVDSMKTELPAILHKRFELKGLTENQALEAITLPAQLSTEEGFASVPFEYSREALHRLIQELKSKDTGRIEAFLLQVCCESIETVVLDKQNRLPGQALTIQSGDLPRFDKIYEDYYDNKIADLPKSLQGIAKRIIENELVAINPGTGLAMRLNADGRKLVAAYEREGASESLLLQLTASFLLRAEPNTTNGFNFEVSHDTLLEPILRAKREREEQEERKKHQRRLRRAVLAVIFSLALLIGALIFGAWALQQRNEARRQQKVAGERFRSFLLEQMERQKLEIETLERRIIIYRNGTEYKLADEAAADIEKIKTELKQNEDQIKTLGQ